ADNVTLARPALMLPMLAPPVVSVRKMSLPAAPPVVADSDVVAFTSKGLAALLPILPAAPVTLSVTPEPITSAVPLTVPDVIEPLSAERNTAVLPPLPSIVLTLMP